jgi:DNA-binding MarR family transcriptional regulator
MIGVLDKHILESKFSLSEARVLYELNNIEHCTARKIMYALSIDEGYLSRIIERFIKLGYVKKTRTENDKRAFSLVVTPKGKSQFQKINQASAKAVANMLQNISEKDVALMLLMMEGIQNILTKSNEKPVST